MLDTWSLIRDTLIMNLKLFLRIGINTLIGAVLVYFWLKLVDINAIINELKSVSLWVLPLPVICFCTASFLRALRLKVLLKEYNIPKKNLWLLTMLGQLLSFTIPVRAGEIAKGVYLSTHFNIHFGKSVIWIFLDRFVDFWFSLVIALVLLLFIPTALPESLMPILLFLVVLITTFSVFILIKPDAAKKLFNLFSQILIAPKLKILFNKFTGFIIESFVFLKKGTTDNILVIILTIVALIIEALSWYIGFFAVTGKNSDFLSMLLGSVLTSLTYLIPAAPGYVGSAEASGLAVFTYGLGLDKTMVSAVTVLIHILTLVYILFFGIISLYSLKFDLRLVWKKFRKNG